ncbi:MAG TPA: methyltransferase domain-containing protein [Verrucomicrobiae bacterium]|jgi:SAM-dependent methyltransferase|nr:methyltransferase domain-containing protein [Verrucomicrobiae bacterium]
MHYNSAYYQSHYGRLLDDGGYFNLRAQYWKKAIMAARNIPEDSLLLDYGCGTGQVSMAFQNTHFYDVAEFSRELIARRGKVVYADNADIPVGMFDFVLSSHALEHSPRPHEDLLNFRRFAKPTGQLLLILPVEKDLRKAMEVDGNNHLYCWTFQTICNLLHATEWKPLVQTYVYDSFGLGFLSKLLPPQQAVSLAWTFGRLKKGFKSMMIVAAKADSALARETLRELPASGQKVVRQEAPAA